MCYAPNNGGLKGDEGEGRVLLFRLSPSLFLISDPGTLHGNDKRNHLRPTKKRSEMFLDFNKANVPKQRKVGAERGAKHRYN